MSRQGLWNFTQVLRKWPNCQRVDSANLTAKFNFVPNHFQLSLPTRCKYIHPSSSTVSSIFNIQYIKPFIPFRAWIDPSKKFNVQPPEKFHAPMFLYRRLRPRLEFGFWSWWSNLSIQVSHSVCASLIFSLH